MATRRLLVEVVGNDDSLQAAMGRAGATTAGFGDRIAAAGQRISGIGKKLTTDLTLPIVAIGALSVKSAVDFQNSMELIHTQAGVSQSAVDSLSKSVLALAGPTATAPDELSAGLYHLTSQGLRGAQALSALKSAAEGAKLGQADLEDVTNALGAVLVSKISGITSYSQAMGELNSIVGSGDMRMQDLADAMGTGLAAAAKVAGVSLDQVGGALATFGDNNIRGAKAGTLLVSTMRVLGHQSTAATAALQDLGVSSDTLQQKLATHGLTDAIGYLRDKIAASGKTTAEVSSDLSEAFGGKQSTGIKILIAEFERLQTKVKDVSAGGDKFASDWQAYTQTTAYHLASMGAQMQATGVTLGTILLPVIAKIADYIGRLAARFESLSPSVQKVILIVGGCVAALGPLLYVLGNLGTVIAFLVNNPITLLIAGIAVLVAAFAAAVLWPDKLRDVLEKMGLSAHAAGEVVAGLRDVFHVVETAVMQLVGVIRDNWSTIRAIITGVVDVIATAIRVAVGVIMAIWDTFGSEIIAAVKTAWDFIKSTIQNDLEIVHGIIDVITGLIHGDWSKVWQGIEEIVGGTLKEIWTLLQSAVSLLGDVAAMIGTALYKGIVQPIVHLAEDLWHMIESAISSAVHLVMDWIPNEVAQIGSGIVDGIVHGITGLAGKVGGALKSGVHDALNFVKSGFGIFSPSKVFAAEVGLPIAQGILVGFGQGIGPLKGTIDRALRGSVPNVVAAGGGAAGLAGHGGRGRGGAVTLNVTLNAPNYLGDRRQLGETVVTELSKWARRNGNANLRAVLGGA